MVALKTLQAETAHWDCRLSLGVRTFRYDGVLPEERSEIGTRIQMNQYADIKPNLPILWLKATFFGKTHIHVRVTARMRI
jgi:hypothetical protein